MAEIECRSVDNTATLYHNPVNDSIVDSFFALWALPIYIGVDHLRREQWDSPACPRSALGQHFGICLKPEYSVNHCNTKKTNELGPQSIINDHLLITE